MRFTTVPIDSIARERNSWGQLTEQLHRLPQDRALAVSLEGKTYAAVMSAAHNAARQLGLRVRTRYDGKTKQMFVWKASQSRNENSVPNVREPSAEAEDVAAKRTRTDNGTHGPEKAFPGVGEDIRRLVCKHPDWSAEKVKETVEKVLGVDVKENTFNSNYFGAKATIKTARALGYWKELGIAAVASPSTQAETADGRRRRNFKRRLAAP